ncbi:MAG: SLC13/DASS family transporter [Gemmatimonadales bacterium]|nr:SLC13/DASS family transporter [Gemmatimonadales bacterium]
MSRIDSKLIARAAGPALFALALAFGPEALTPEGRKALGVTAWMITWLITEAVPIVATSLLPLVLFPLLGVAPIKQAAAPYSNELVFLFMAGFFLAAALERWQSHVRVAYRLVLAVGLTSRRAVLGIMLATGFISAWISNTASAAMMYPIALAVGALFPKDLSGDNTRTSLMLGVAYAASIGGVMTMIGSPPNLVVVGAMKEMVGQSVSFAQWIGLGLPIALLLLPLCWVILVYVCFPTRTDLGAGAREILATRLAGLGPIRGGEARVLAIFGATALAWFLRERKELGGVVIPGLVDVFPGLTDTGIGVMAAVLLFLVSGSTVDGSRRPLLTWDEARRIPWDVLLFFGGGLSLADAIEKQGLTTWLAGHLEGLAGLPPVVLYLGLAITTLVLSELASNLAVAAMMMPIAVALAKSLGQPPLVLMLVAGFASSTGFMLPVATPPNTIVFGSGLVSVRQMAKAGFLLDLVAIIVVVAAIALLTPIILAPTP